MSEWQVTVTCAGGDADAEVSGEAMGKALAALEAHGAAGSRGGGAFEFTMTAKGATPARASAAAVRAVERAKAAAGLPDWPVTRVEVLPAEGAVPTLVGIPEIARMLGVHPERARELATTNEAFPRPIGQLGKVKVWTEESVQRWAEAWPRRAGRPRKGAGATTARKVAAS